MCCLQRCRHRYTKPHPDRTPKMLAATIDQSGLCPEGEYFQIQLRKLARRIPIAESKAFGPSRSNHFMPRYYFSFGHPVAGFFLARDFFTASFESPSIFNRSGAGPRWQRQPQVLRLRHCVAMTSLRMTLLFSSRRFVKSLQKMRIRIQILAVAVSFLVV